MSQRIDQPGSRWVMTPLALTIIALAVFGFPKDGEGASARTNTVHQVENCVTDGLGFSDKCLTQNGKAVYWVRLEALHPTKSKRSFYSLKDRTASASAGYKDCQQVPTD